ncbi:MAG: UvrB/UvrC motif-containing protein [Oscillibacter sp.]|jgi:protein arginine kinase activator|nr:UvrB/UvrC motif-containing protein [Oscillibacter sp.]
MKCENCGKNEVSFVYQSNINGKVTEKHLCSECAEKLGYTQKIAAQQRKMMSGMRSFWNDGFFGGGLLDDFFAPTPRLMGGMDRFFGEDLFDDFFSDMPALGTAPAEETKESAEDKKNKEALVDEKEQSRFARMRQLNALRLEMKRAVHQENFEHAAEVRDQIRALEKEEKESGESK